MVWGAPSATSSARRTRPHTRRSSRRSAPLRLPLASPTASCAGGCARAGRHPPSARLRPARASARLQLEHLFSKCYREDARAAALREDAAFMAAVEAPRPARLLTAPACEDAPSPAQALNQGAVRRRGRHRPRALPRRHARWLGDGRPGLGRGQGDLVHSCVSLACECRSVCVSVCGPLCRPLDPLAARC